MFNHSSPRPPCLTLTPVRRGAKQDHLPRALHAMEQMYAPVRSILRPIAHLPPTSPRPCSLHLLPIDLHQREAASGTARTIRLRQPQFWRWHRTALQSHNPRADPYRGKLRHLFLHAPVV